MARSSGGSGSNGSGGGSCSSNYCWWWGWCCCCSHQIENDNIYHRKEMVQLVSTLLHIGKECLALIHSLRLEVNP